MIKLHCRVTVKMNILYILFCNLCYDAVGNLGLFSAELLEYCE